MSLFRSLLRAPLAVAAATAALLSFNPLTAPPAAAAAAASAPVQHVFVIVLENENGQVTFSDKTPAPYLARTLTAQGAYVPNYYGIGHASLDNYIAMVSGQAPNFHTQGDCQTYSDFSGAPQGKLGLAKGQGCVYPASVKTVAQQLDGAGRSWKGYMEDMGKDLSREAATCGHPPVGAKDNTQAAAAADQYATRHNPFMYFHSIIDNQSYCDQHVVSLDALSADLRSVATTPNYVFITPNLCNDGHDAPCANGDEGGLAQADQFLQTWVPQITHSPAFLQDGLLMIVFDEADTGATACCHELPGPSAPLPGIYGPGGGKTGAVLLSPFIKPGTVTDTAYNHYAMLKSVEQFFGLDPLGYAGGLNLQAFGPDVFTNAP